MRYIATRRALALAAVIAISCLVAACQSSVHGQIYFDENSNGEFDSGESGVPYAKLLVSRDSKTVAEQYSDATGAFDIPIKQRAGYVCVDTDLSFAEANANYVLYSLGQDVQAQRLKVSPPAAKALTTTSSDDEEEEEEETAESDEDEVAPSQPEGWIGLKYCKNVKFKGFEVDIPVLMSFAEAKEELPARLTHKCYAGETCEVRIPYPLGCTLDPLNLPDGLKLASMQQQAVESYDEAFGVVTFSETPYSAQKAQSTAPTFYVKGFQLAELDLKVDEDIPVGTTSVELKPTAECYGQDLEFESIPIQLIRDVDVDLEQHLVTPLTSGGFLNAGTLTTVRVSIENTGHSIISDGDLTVTPPAGSVIQSAAGCYNYGTKLKCDVDGISPGSTFVKDVYFTLPSPTADESASVNALFKAEGLGGEDGDDEESADPITFMIKGTSS